MGGSSAASTSGISAGQGVGFTYGGMIGATLGIAGGYSGSNSSASQNSARHVSQFFSERLRQLLMQNAESYRELNASVVTTVTEGQDYGVTSEVVANHNHCHSLTLMYFEVLRHYAIFQELSHVEECVFVPLLMTDFTTENIYKWKDVLAKNLLPIPSDTYLQSHSLLRSHSSLRSYTLLSTTRSRRHPLLKAFDANERVKTNWERVDFPAADETYADGIITQIQGRLTMNVNIPRPKTKYDRILSLPVTSKIVETKVVDPLATAKATADQASVKPQDVLSGGWSWLFRNSSGPRIKYKTIEDEVFYTKKIFDAFMYLDANYESVPPAQCIRIMEFEPQTVEVKDENDESVNVTTTGDDFFDNDLISKKLWTAYAEILNFDGVFQMMNAYFKGRLIAEWDRIFYQELLPDIFAHIVDSITISYGEVKTEKDSDGNEKLIQSSGGFNLDFSTERKYTGGSRKINVNFNSQGEVGKKRSELPLYISLSSNLDDIEDIKNHIKLNIGRVSIDYETAYFQGSLYRGYVRDDLLDGTNLYIPLNSRDKINPRKEDKYIVNQLIEHLNSNIEHYNKVLWYNLDRNRRFMLLDGFNIEVFNSFGDSAGFRSLASVVKNELITVVGNSLVFPVADGYKVSKSYILEKSQENVQKEISLFDYYKPFTPVPPYRVSVPTRGVFMEAIQGKCDACELVKENSSQDWDKFRTEEPTPISPIITPTPTISDYKPQYKDFAPPLVNIQNAPNAPAPAAGLSQLTELLGKAGIFNDITGLEGNQQNVIDTYLSNQTNAKAFAEMAKNLLTQQRNTQNSDDFIKRIEQARDNGAISEDDYKELTKQHLQQQIDGGESAKENAQLERERSKPSLTDAAIDAIEKDNRFKQKGR